MGVTVLKEMQCGSCGVFHAIPEAMFDSCYKEGGYWHCPNGHRRGYDKGAEAAAQEKLRRERDQLKQDAARLQDEISAANRRAEAAEKKIIQTKRRAHAGVCQCCNRTFLNVQRHMKSRHPNVVPMALKAEAVS